MDTAKFAKLLVSEKKQMIQHEFQPDIFLSNLLDSKNLSNVLVGLRFIYLSFILDIVTVPNVLIQLGLMELTYSILYSS